MCEREALPLFFPITKEALAECNAGHAPEACHRIHAEDVVKNETDGNECVEWCHMTGLLLPSAARMDVMGCFKAEAWAAFSLLNWGGVIWTAVIAACAYQLIRSCGQKETPSDPSKANPDENNGTTNGTPSTTEFSERGPYLNAKLPWGITEMAFRSASKNDRAAEKLKLISDLVLSQFEPFMDIYSGVSLLAQGQPYYGFGMLAATLLPSWFHDRDPFQRGMVKELQRSIHQGYSTRGMLEHQDREGRYEGTMSAIVAACALIRTPSLPVSTTLTLLISVVSSFFISIPTGCRARKILDSGIDKDNYYGAEEAKRDMSWGVALIADSTMLELVMHYLESLLSLWFWIWVWMLLFEQQKGFFEDGIFGWQTRQHLGFLSGTLVFCVQVVLLRYYKPERTVQTFEPGKYKLKKRMGERILQGQVVRLTKVGSSWGKLAEGKWVQINRSNIWDYAFGFFHAHAIEENGPAKDEKRLGHYSYEAPESQFVYCSASGGASAGRQIEKDAGMVVEITQVTPSTTSVNGRLKDSEVYIQLAFLADHDLQPDDHEPEEIFTVAEALAISWKDRRKELGKLQRSRNGYAKKETGAAFVSEAAELEQEYEEPQAGLDFVAMAGVCPCPLSPLSILREKRRLMGMLPDELPHPEVLLVSSPGFGVLDSGRGRSVIGRDTLTEFHQLWRAAGVPIPTEIHEVNHFRFGNGEKETTESVIRLPVTLGGKQGTIRTAIVRGQAPFLISRNALQTLKAVIDFGKQQLTLFEEQVLVPLVTNEAGQFAVKVVGSSDQVNFEQEVMCSTFTDNSGSMPSPVSKDRPAGSSKVEQESSIDHSLPGDSESLQYWELASTLDCLPVHYVRQLKSQLRDLDVQMKQPPEHGTPADYSVLRVAEDDDEAVRKALTRLHKNLGHPSQADLVRLLKHAQASEKAIKLARQLTPLD
ncbi:Putative transposon protein [Durusdinium trenchii]|uniref:Transposon protein n=1 Tax=Durusdinium trenchii TaxID=1381693 RepID=A0ABP0IXD3_9DINO